MRYVFERNADECTIIKLSNAQYGSDRHLEIEPKKQTKVDPSLRMIGFFYVKLIIKAVPLLVICGVNNIVTIICDNDGIGLLSQIAITIGLMDAIGKVHSQHILKFNSVITKGMSHSAYVKFSTHNCINVG